MSVHYLGIIRCFCKQLFLLCLAESSKSSYWLHQVLVLTTHHVLEKDILEVLKLWPMRFSIQYDILGRCVWGGAAWCGCGLDGCGHQGTIL